MIKVFVQKTMAQAVVDTPLTSGSKGLTVEFVFSEDWNGLEKTAVFETSSFYKETEQLTGETIEVPEDVMAWANETLYVGVYGTSQNGATVIPTVYADCGKIQKGANDSEGGRPLIPAQSDILQNQIDSLGDRVAWLEETGGGGGAGILLDTTLTQPGKAADAKAVGDALEQKQDAGNYLTDHNTFVGDVNTSSAAFYEAFSARKPCFLLRSDAGSGMVMWVAHDCTSRAARFYNVTPDGTVRYATLEGLVFSYESAAGGSGNVFVGDANTTVAEFYEAYQAGKVCFLKRQQGGSGIVTWVANNCSTSGAWFYHVNSTGVVESGRLGSDGTWTINRAFSDVVKSVNGITPDPSGKVTLPIPTTLPNPHKLTFSGAVNAEYDGSEAVEVVIPQGGGGGGFELVASVELAENVTSVEVALSKPCTDLIISAYRTYNGFSEKNPHFVKVDDNGTETAVGARYNIFPNNNSWAAWFPATVDESGNNRNSVVTGFYHYEKDIGVFSGFSSTHEARGGFSSKVGMTGVAMTVGDFIETLKFGVNVTDAYIAKGVKIFVWGC